jgi:hypothetical protein
MALLPVRGTSGPQGERDRLSHLEGHPCSSPSRVQVARPQAWRIGVCVGIPRSSYPLPLFLSSTDIPWSPGVGVAILTSQVGKSLGGRRSGACLGAEPNSAGCVGCKCRWLPGAEQAGASPEQAEGGRGLDKSPASQRPWLAGFAVALLLL